MNLSNQLFISCDWGTSNFRLRLVDQSTMEVVTEIKLPNGIGMMNAEWKEKHAAAGESKEAFFLKFLSGNIDTWNKWIPSGQSIPIVISGMASSTIGIRSLEYAPIPFPVSGKTAITQWIPSSGVLKHPVLLISGVKTDDDVMRGEETQLIGLLEIIQIDNSRRHLFILPGTHSKHIEVDGGNITDFKTYMTGELFALISRQSILSNSVKAEKLSEEHNEQHKAFRKGICFSVHNNLLHTLFTVRTNQLFNQFTVEENYYYLSGLVIGAELAAIEKKNEQLVIAGEGSLVELYKIALEELGFQDRLLTVPGDKMDQALIAGQRKLLQTHASH